MDPAQIQKTLESMQDQQAALGSNVSKTVLKALQDKLAELRDEAEGGLPSPQRRQVTVLFAGVEGFTSLVEALPESNVLALINMLWQRLDEEIVSYGGRVDKHVGDVVMAVFGAPVGHENDAAQAVRAALAMRKTLREFIHEIESQLRVEAAVGTLAQVEPQRLRRLSIKIGINTGPVLLGQVGRAAGDTVMGDTVNLASRLQEVAPAGEILVSRQTRQLVQAWFRLEDVAPLNIKGKSRPVAGYLIAGLQERQPWAPRLTGKMATQSLVGRDTDLQTLSELLHTAMNTRQCQLVVIVGDAGIGKSHLVSAWAQRVNEGSQFFYSRSEQRWQQLPYALVRDLLGGLFQIRDSDGKTTALEKLERGVAHLLQAEDKVNSACANALALLLGLRDEEEQRLASGDRERVFAQVYNLLEAATQRTAVTILVLEDLQWADEGSLLLLRYILQRAVALPLLIVCQIRPVFKPTLEAWLEETAVPMTTLSLPPLSDAHSRKLVARLLQKLPRIPDALLNLIVETARGNPFYMEELINVLVEDGVLTVDEEAWALATRQFTRVRIPATLTGVIQARLDRLPMLERVVLQWAAVVGQEFWQSALLTINQATSQPFDEAQLAQALSELATREMIYPLVSGTFAGQRAFEFKHPLLREVAYESVLLRERPLYHRQTAAWLVAQSGERVSEHAALIARHYELAGESNAAADMYALASERALERNDPPQAIGYLEKALPLLDQPQHVVAMLRLQAQLGDLYFEQARLQDARQTFETLRQTAELDGALPEVLRAWYRLAQVHQMLQAPEQALACLDEAQTVARLVGEEIELLRIELLRTEIAWRLGLLSAASAAGQAALSLAERLAAEEETATVQAWLARIHEEMETAVRSPNAAE